MAAPVGLVTTRDPPHERRQRPLPRRVEEPLAGQLLAKLPQGQLQGPHALGLDALDDQLVAAPRGIDVDPPAANHFQAVVQVELAPGRPRSATWPHGIWA